jgi:hypothetical protein
VESAVHHEDGCRKGAAWFATKVPTRRWLFLTPSDQPYQEAGQGKSADHHEPVAAVELEEPAVRSNFRVKKHRRSAAQQWISSVVLEYHGEAPLAVTLMQRR